MNQHIVFRSVNATLKFSRTYSRLVGGIWNRVTKKRDYKIVLPGKVSPARPVPPHIVRPPYADSGFVSARPEEIDIKTPHVIQRMRVSGLLARKVLDEVASRVKAGVTTDELDRVVHEKTIELGAYPSPLNYKGFPKSVCTSVNNVACHGIPDDRPLEEGDIISIDVSVYFDGYHGDCAGTYGVGNIDSAASKLIEVARRCRDQAISICRPGEKFCQIGNTISKIAKENQMSVVPAFCGHGIGSYFHGLPDIFHFENDGEGVMLPGMVFTIEPAISEGGTYVTVLEDGWTAVMLDNSRAAQFEHTVLITESGVDILTVSDACSTGATKEDRI